ncbi:hypothetical protein EVAR_64208_1 [Eumeta japonica]|uniref:Uncharacterized protein n=1 Tax=Eumeta variegata TaxID=151549 RepID=A0A4C1Z3R3_EUMVA|nr:hypothetical protein EVAR_64208_1 [Eumeta japonica]
MWCPRSRKGSDTGGSRRTASPDGPGAALGGSVGFGLPHGLETGERRQPGWPYAAGDNSRRRVSLLTHEYAGTLWSNVGPNISRSAGPHDSWRPRGRTTGSGGTALTSFCGASTRIPERPHHVQIIEYILGFLGPGKDGEN